MAVDLAGVGSSGIHKSTKNRSAGFMLAHVIDLLALCWLRLAQIGLMLGHVGLKTAQDRFMLAPRWPHDAQNGLPRPPRFLTNASGRPRDDLKIDIFEVFVRKTRKCIWSYYSNVLLIFWDVFFHRFWSKILSFFSKCWALLPHMHQEASRWPQDGPTWLSGGNLGPTRAQVGSKLPQDEPNLAPSWLKLGLS